MARTIFGLAAVGALLFGVYCSLRLALADYHAHKFTAGSLARAVRLDPGNAQYRAWLAAVEDSTGGDPRAMLESATALNPREASLWIQLGLYWEMRRDYTRSERCLLEAARASVQFDPRSTLANYYFRRGDADRFWHWTRQALEIPYGDLRPLFRLCWYTSQDPQTILDRALPAAAPTLRQYLVFLLTEGHVKALEPAARRFLPLAEARDVSLLTSACDHLLGARQYGAAVSLWNTLCARRWTGHASATAAAPVTNAEFSAAPLGAGLDWRVPSVPGLTLTRAASPPAWKLSLSGGQPERCVLLWQYLPLAAGGTYSLAVEYRTDSIPPQSGVQWLIEDAARPGPPLAASADLSSADWATERARLTAPKNLDLARLVLVYRRRPGTVRPEGSLYLRRIELRMAP